MYILSFIMEEVGEEKKEVSGENTQMYYIIGAIALVVVVVAGYMLRPKPATLPATTSTPSAVEPTPEQGQITKLACEKQFYNPVIGLGQYYLSVEGVDVKPATKVDCDFAISVAGKVVASESATSPLTDEPSRGGSTFRCGTSKLKLDKNVPTKVDVAIKDDNNASITCSKTYLLP